MKTLPQRFLRHGFEFQQIARGKRALCYKKQIPNQPQTAVYEVFKIKIQPQRRFKSFEFERAEIYPCNESFGFWAFTFKSENQALEKFNTLEKKGRGSLRPIVQIA